MRSAFINNLISEARHNDRIFLIVADLGYSVVEPFASEFPDRYINVGVAEQNMTGTAAGLASEGFHVFTYSIANFPTFRCAEFIRNDVAYHKLPVTIVSVGGGVAYGSLGYSHQALQDYALMRSFPGLLIGSPGDPVETKAVVKYLSDHPQPSYLRLGKAGEPVLHQNPVSEIRPGQLLPFHPKPATGLILSTGAALNVCLAAAGKLEGDWVICSMPIWAGGNGDYIREQLAAYTRIITVEDHLAAGGFGSFIREIVTNGLKHPAVRSVALSDEVCNHVGSQAYLNRTFGLSADAVLAAALTF